MTSIFDLKTNINELSSSNNGTSRLTYDQIAPTRDVTSSNFPNGAIYIKWTVSGEKWWIPSRSYLRMRCQLTRGDGNQFTLSDQVAPSMNLMANLFQNAELRINDKTISRIPNYVSQIEALEQRMSKSKSQMDGLYASTNFMQASFEDRQKQIASVASTALNKFIIGLSDNLDIKLLVTNTLGYIAATGVVTFATGVVPDVSTIFNPGDEIQLAGANAAVKFIVTSAIDATSLQCQINAAPGDIAALALNNADISALLTRKSNDARNLSQFELTWTPCLSLFKIDHAMPSGKYELILNPFPQSIYQLQAIESKNPTKYLSSVAKSDVVSVADADKVRFDVKDLYFYCNTVDGPRADNMSYLLDLNQTSCQQETVKNASFAQRNYDISPSTYALTVAFQDGRCNNDSRIPSSIFKCYGKDYEPDKELSLNRMYISYAGQQRPSPDADPSFDTTIDNTVQRYVDTMIENGSYFDNGGSESIEDYHKRGSYYYFGWSRDGTDRSTRVAVHSGFSALLGTAQDNANCLLFAHSKQVGKITVADGNVIGVEIEDA
jgi:hypothetical protein